DGILVVSLPRLQRVAIIDVAAEKVLGTPSLADPRGLAFDAKGRLLALSGRKVLRFAPRGADLGKSEDLITGLEDPQQLTLDPEGRIYVSDLGASNQVKIFDAGGRKV